MKIEVKVFNEWRERKRWRVIHWFGISTIFEPPKHFNPLLELHLGILNFDIRIMVLKSGQIRR